MPLIRSMVALIVLLTAACSSGDDGGPTTPPPSGGGGNGRVILDNPSFATNIQEIFDRRGCSVSFCHGSTQSAGLRLSSGASYQSLVGVAATQEQNMTRVIAGDAENSYLTVKVEGRQSSGTRMPQGGSALDNIDLANIRNWIDRGAANN